jgi:tRNA (guanine37-N1)-methyltransferase
MRLTMDFHVMTLFPEMVSQGLSTSILGRAMEKNLISLECINIRDYSADQKHHKVDDYTYGGGAGMLMQAQPVYDCYKSLESRIDPQHTKRVIYVTPQGSVFNQQMAMEFAKSDDLIFLCGHYEGIDERVLEEIVTDYVSIGDYVLTGGELPAMVMIDTISRLVPGVLNNDISAETESFTDGLLEYPQYSRPEEWMGKKVPPVLLSGDHKKVDEWRLEKSLERTKERRPDLYEAWIKAHPPAPPKKRRRKKASVSVQTAAENGMQATDAVSGSHEVPAG